MPTYAAAGAIAIETVAALEILLKGVDGRDEVGSQCPGQVKRYISFTRVRCRRSGYCYRVVNSGSIYSITTSSARPRRRLPTSFKGTSASLYPSYIETKKLNTPC